MYPLLLENPGYQLHLVPVKEIKVQVVDSSATIVSFEVKANADISVVKNILAEALAVKKDLSIPLKLFLPAKESKEGSMKQCLKTFHAIPQDQDKITLFSTKSFKTLKTESHRVAARMRKGQSKA